MEILGIVNLAVGNVVYSNGGVGIDAFDEADILNNLIYDNGNIGLRLWRNPFTSRLVQNNTIWHNVGSAVWIDGGGRVTSLHNNLIVVQAGLGIEVVGTDATFTSDYNLVFPATAAAQFGRYNGAAVATLAGWQAASTRDSHSLSADPRFVDMNGADNLLGYDDVADVDHGSDDNFHLRGGSPAIDRGKSFDTPKQDQVFALRADDPGTTNLGDDAYFEHSTVDSVFNAPLVGIAQNLRGDNLQRDITLDFPFPFYNVNYNVVTVSSNGLMQFGLSAFANDGTNTTNELSTRPRIASLWDDLRTDRTGDDVFIDRQSDRITFRWNATNKVGETDVQFAATLFASGDIRFDYGPGNTDLTPTVGISRGNSLDYLLAAHDGLANLANVTSIEFRFEPGFYDLGAFEFGGSSSDVTPPAVGETTPAGIASEAIIVPFDQIVIEFSETMNRIDLAAPGSYELRGAARMAFSTMRTMSSSRSIRPRTPARRKSRSP